MKKTNAARYPLNTMMNHKSPSHSSVIITGLARNVSKTIEDEIERLLGAFSGFAQVSFLIIESDSSDRTVAKLEMLSKRLTNFSFISLGQLSKELPNRIDRISYCRSFAQKEIVKMNKLFDYVCVADLDGVNSMISREAIESCWTRSDWSVCTANQVGPYYDIYALRAENWCENNAWLERMKLVSEGIHPQKATNIAIGLKQKVIPTNSEWIEVISAFGGLAIYTRESFQLANYSSKDSSGNIICEHVSFNEAVRECGGRIFINPMLINSYGNVISGFSKRAKYILKYALSFTSPKLFLKLIG